ncbi:MAG TPA: carboxypeptidase-like regulatory domain-containing protein, partial [Candidatus Solibacter sp.]|nr:carboxypeptidase-like regulatory domain-containing protein [Candidatus Solibacter sp.]
MRLFSGVLLAWALHAQNASVAVSVVDAVNNRPIPNVELRLAGRSTPSNATTLSTDASGKARFENLRPGAYFIEYVRDGYLDSKAAGSTYPAQIKDADAKVEVNMQLTPTARLSGRVLDENGRPMKGVIVHSWLTESVTDEEGQFRLEALMPRQARLEFQIPKEIRQKTLERDANTGVTIGYPAVEFYPGVADPAEAAMLQLSGGVDLHGYDVRLRRVQLADFAGRTMARAGVPLTNAHVELQTRAPGTPMLDASFSSHPVDEDGSFRFELIPPGAYTLLVYRGENGTGLPYILPIEIGKDGVRDKEIIVPPFQTIRGILRVKDDA